MDELDKMKEQLNLLHQKLAQERIVNERLVRRTVNTNVGRINRNHFIITLITAIGIPYSIFVFGGCTYHGSLPLSQHYFYL